MKYLLDTNICIYLIKKKPPEVFARFRTLRVGDVGISAITYSELAYGVANSGHPERNRLALDELVAPLEIVPYSPEVAPVYGEIRAHLRRAGSPIGPLDLLIAAHARYLGVTLVTNDERKLARVPGIATENWVAAE